MLVVNGPTVTLVLADLGDHGSGGRSAMSLLPEVDTTTSSGRLKKARLQADMKQQDVANLLGVNVQCVSNWENWRGRPRRLSIEQTMNAVAAAGQRSQGPTRAPEIDEEQSKP